MGNLNSIELIIGNPLPIDFQEFIKSNGGLSHYERFYIDDKKNCWEVSSYLDYDDLHKLTQEFLQSYNRKLVPFAYDMGGWHFCLCMDDTAENGKIIVNRWSDYLPTEQFLVIANSFDEFINRLQVDDERFDSPPSV